MKIVGERMDIISAYREIGSYHGAAKICSTTPKTVKRVVERQADSRLLRRDCTDRRPSSQ